MASIKEVFSEYLTPEVVNSMEFIEESFA